MRNLSMLVTLCLPVVMMSCSADHPEPTDQVSVPHADVTRFTRTLQSVLPEGWQITQSEHKTALGNEGVHLYAGNPNVVMDGPKGKYSPYIRLYFRPKATQSEGGEYLSDGSVLSMHLGKTDQYDVYGGSVGTDLTEQVQEAFGLSDESQNN